MTQKIKIVHLITTLTVGGAEMMLYRLVSSMDQQRFESVVISLTDGGDIGERIKEAGFRVYSLGMRRGQPTPLGLGRLVSLLKQEHPTILQTWMYHANLLGIVASKLAGKPTVVWNIRCSTFEFSQKQRLSDWTTRTCALISASPRLIVVNSEAGQHFHTQLGYHPREWRLIPNGINTEQYHPNAEARFAVRQELGLESDTPLIGLVARFDPIKGHQTFLQAAANLKQWQPEAHFLMVGLNVTIENKSLMDSIRKGGLLDNVHLLGLRHDIPRLTAALDIATSSSDAEGFSNTVGEAMSCGVPCAVTDVGDSAKIVSDTGKVVPARDPQALATAWNELLLMENGARLELGIRARHRVESLFALDYVVKQYEDLYESLFYSHS